MINQDAFLELAKDSNLSIVSRVQNLLIASMESGNSLPISTTFVAKTLGCSKSSASTALKFWREKGWLTEQPRSFKMSPKVAWKGGASDHHAALRLVRK